MTINLKSRVISSLGVIWFGITHPKNLLYILYSKFHALLIALPRSPHYIKVIIIWFKGFPSLLRRSAKARRKALASVLAVLTLITGLQLFIRPDSVKAAWFDDAWAYRTKITFGNTGSADANKKVKFDIDTATLITAGKMQSDCGDSRFTDFNGRLLRYYIDSAGGACNTVSTDYYVLIPTINAGNTDIYHYYASPYAANATEAAQ